MRAPELVTARLRLRAHRAEDFDALAAIWGDPDVTRHIGGQPRSRQDVWSTLLRNIGHWPTVGYGYWVVTDAGSGEILGEAGYADHKRGLPAELAAGPEGGWAFGSSAWGKGIAILLLRKSPPSSASVTQATRCCAAKGSASTGAAPDAR
jgi:RimJ/RimL family protein N-acetyltransferase